MLYFLLSFWKWSMTSHLALATIGWNFPQKLPANAILSCQLVNIVSQSHTPNKQNQVSVSFYNHLMDEIFLHFIMVVLINALLGNCLEQYFIYLWWIWEKIQDMGLLGPFTTWINKKKICMHFIRPHAMDRNSTLICDSVFFFLLPVSVFLLWFSHYLISMFENGISDIVYIPSAKVIQSVMIKIKFSNFNLLIGSVLWKS